MILAMIKASPKWRDCCGGADFQVKIAFYAPLKPPTSPVPSGDRKIARGLMKALAGAGHEVFLASSFRSFDKTGNPERQARIMHIGEKLGQRLLKRFHGAKSTGRPDLWFTYHLYHKAPDWIGPVISSGLGIPYVVAEASYAPKQANGPWAGGHEAVGKILKNTDLAIALNRSDIAGITPCLGVDSRIEYLAPFLDASFWRRAIHNKTLMKSLGIDAGIPLLLSVAMMREGDKSASYELLAQALIKISNKKWHLLVAGDGAAKRHVQKAFAPLAGRVSWLGKCGPERLAELYSAADFFVWPAIGEAFGMAFLEAQAAGLPVIGARYGGVADIVDDGATGLLAKYNDVDDFARAICILLDNPARTKNMGLAAAAMVLAKHDLSGAAKRLGEMLEGLRI